MAAKRARGKVRGRTGATAKRVTQERSSGRAAGRHQRAGPRGKPKLLSGGNPQIAMAYGDDAVRAYIAAMPAWKRRVGAQLDALVTRTVPHVRTAVKWNTPFYGVTGQGWFLAFHCFANYVKVTFFRGAALRPPPPEPSKDPNVRYLHLHEHDALDDAHLVRWIRQAAALPGWLTADIRRP
jgi:hypothetical protein